MFYSSFLRFLPWPKPNRLPTAAIIIPHTPTLRSVSPVCGRVFISAVLSFTVVYWSVVTSLAWISVLLLAFAPLEVLPVAPLWLESVLVDLWVPPVLSVFSSFGVVSVESEAVSVGGVSAGVSPFEVVSVSLPEVSVGGVVDVSVVPLSEGVTCNVTETSSVDPSG